LRLVFESGFSEAGKTLLHDNENDNEVHTRDEAVLENDKGEDSDDELEPWQVISYLPTFTLKSD
jgi:hypothetical protein